MIHDINRLGQIDRADAGLPVGSLRHGSLWPYKMRGGSFPNEK
jgi:hypothetical protein